MRIDTLLDRMLRIRIENGRQLLRFVVRSALLCVVVAVGLDVVNQLVFFIDWQTAIRSWVVTVFVALVIAVPFLVAIAHANMRLYQAKQAVDELSRTDPLTGIPNRRALLEFARVPELSVMALAIVDIDRFKRVNDTHGHLVGDEVIRVVAHTMVSELGGFGHVGRLGGEEFALLSSSSAPELMQRLWDFRDRIAKSPIIVGSTVVRISISIGVAQRDKGQSFEGLFVEADRALYLAKAAGRNRVVSASDDLVGRTEAVPPAAAGEMAIRERAFRGRA
jgi:diguanylate cyclase (GGDEF)-like protein